MRLAQKAAVIIDAASGIGTEIAEAFAGEGAKIVIANLKVVKAAKKGH